MAPRRFLLPLLSALALLSSPFALIPLAAQAQPINYRVDVVGDTLAFETSTPVGTYCKLEVSDDCSLRRAIGEANRDAGASQISFGVQGTLTLDSKKGGLVISAPNLTIDASPVSPATGVTVRLDGDDAAFPGFKITTSGVTIKALSITGFTGQPDSAAVLIEGLSATGNTISGNYIGVITDGLTLDGNLYGVRIRNGAAQNTISDNIIGGSEVYGIEIADSDDNTVTGSGIGIGAADAALRNEEAGIVISSSSGQTSTGNEIGGTGSSLANTISGNGLAGRTDRAGILLKGSGTTGNFIYANRIGLSSSGTSATAVPNAGDGIRIEDGASDNEIAGSLAAPVVVSGNNGYGIRITGTGTLSNTVGGGVYVGLSGNLTAGVANGLGGISVDTGASNTTIVDSVVAGNTSGPGILVTGGAVVGTTISTSSIGRLINPNTSALLTLPNAVGVQVVGAGTTTVSGSTIGDSSQYGVQVQGTTPFTMTASTVVANTLAGVLIEGTSGSVVSTSTITGNLQAGLVLSNTVNARLFNNTVNGNAQTGVLLRGTAGSSVLSNTITANTQGGLLLTTGTVSTTNTSIFTNTISGNSPYGLRLDAPVTTTLRSNFVGLSLARDVAVPNLGNGVEIFGGRNTQTIDTFIAGNTLAGMVVSGTVGTTINNSTVGLVRVGVGYTGAAANGGPGLRITGGAQQTTVSGGAYAGAATLATDPPGIQIDSTDAVTVTNARIGGVIASAGQSVPTLERPFGIGISVTGVVNSVQIMTNTLRFNKGAGISVAGDANRVRMIDNKLSQNGAGIALVGTSLLTARPPTADSGSQSNPNHDIDPPPVDVTNFTDPLRLRVTDAGVISGFVITSTNRTEAGLSPVSACVTCTIQLFRSGPDAAAADGQGWSTVATYPITGTNAQSASSFGVSEDGSFSRQILGGLGSTSGQLLLIATDGFGNSSEYAVFPVRPTVALTPTVSAQSAAPGASVVYTLRLTNTGTLDLTGLKLVTSGTRAEWMVAADPQPNTDFTSSSPFAAGSGRTLTVTLTLPTGSSLNAAAGVTDVTTVTVFKEGVITEAVRLETTVLTQPVVVVEPLTSVGKARPGEKVPHLHTIRNDGNVPVTLTLADQTLDAVGETGLWATTLSARSLPLKPGGQATLRVEVTVPEGAQVIDSQGREVLATTYITGTVPGSPADGYGPITLNLTNTTKVDLEPDAAITGGNQEKQAAAGQQVFFTHTVQNLSNASATFCLYGYSTQISDVYVESATSGFTISEVAPGEFCFTLDTQTIPQQQRFQQAQFTVVVTVNELLVGGNTDEIDIILREATSKVSVASVKNRVLVTRGIKVPRVWVPLLSR